MWNIECCGTTNAVEQQMLWNIECCGTTNAVEQRMGWKKITPANYVEHGMLWNNECCGTSDAVEQRMLWNNECRGTTNAVEKTNAVDQQSIYLIQPHRITGTPRLVE